MREEYCRLCFADIQKKQTIVDWLSQDSCLCGQCLMNLKYIALHTRIEKMPLFILYEYNEFIENMIYQFKEGRDIALRDVFFHKFMKKINDKYRHYTIVLLPSSEEKNQERQFLPVREMLCACTLPIIEPFYKIGNHKQSLQSFENRMQIATIIKRKAHVQLPPTKLLLVDDVCTSGSTLKHAYDELKAHTYKIEALVLCANPLFVESCDKIGLKNKCLRFILDKCHCKEGVVK